MNGNSSGSLTPERVEKFKVVVGGMKEGDGKVFILFTQPDPDAIASAIVLQQILAYLGCDSQIIYSGKISHPQNILLVNTFDLDRRMTHISEVEISNDDHVLLVDSHQIKDSRSASKLNGGKLKIIFDHHRLEGRPPEECPEQFYWIEDCGACTTLVCLLAQELGIVLDKETMVLVALGIYTDTKNLVGVSPRDLIVYSRAIGVDGVSEDFIGLVNYALPPSFYEQLGYILSSNPAHKWRKGPMLLCSVGLIREEEGDHLALFADLLLKEDGVSSVFVYGIYESRDGYFIRVSARSSNLGVQLDKFLAKAFFPFGEKVSGAKVTPDGRSEGGALFALNLGPWMQPNSLQQVKSLVSACMQGWIFPHDDDKEEEEKK